MEDCCYYGIDLQEDSLVGIETSEEIIPSGLDFQEQGEYYTDLSEYDLKYMPEIMIHRDEDFRFDS